MSKLKLPTSLSILIGAIFASVIAVTTHIYLLKWTGAYVAQHAEGTTILKAPYPTWILIASYSTFIFQALTMAIVYFFIGRYLPAKTAIGRGIQMGLVILLLKGELIRQPLMNVLVGNTVLIAVVQQSQAWIATLAATIVIAIFVPIRR